MDNKKIVVAIDGSEHSDRVLNQAVDYAKLIDAQVIFVYCHRKFPVVLGDPYKDREIAATIAEAEQLVAPYLAVLKDAGINYEVRLMEEPAGTTISDVATIEKADLIVMGSRGLTNLASLIVGSVTHRVLQLAPCSVLVVR